MSCSENEGKTKESRSTFVRGFYFCEEGRDFAPSLEKSVSKSAGKRKGTPSVPGIRSHLLAHARKHVGNESHTVWGWKYS